MAETTIRNFKRLATYSAPVHKLGELAVLPDGRKFRFAYSGAVALAPGKMSQGPALIADHTNKAVTANAAIGTYTVTFTMGATAATANQYAGGYLNVNDATGEGYYYKIASNPAADASASITVTLAEPLKVALVASTSEVSLVANPFNGTLVGATTATNTAVGVPQLTVAASTYYWSQTGGACACLIDGTPAANCAVSLSNAVAGALESGVIAQGFVGNMIETGVDTEYKMVNLTLD